MSSGRIGPSTRALLHQVVPMVLGWVVAGVVAGLVLVWMVLGWWGLAALVGGSFLFVLWFWGAG